MPMSAFVLDPSIRFLNHGSFGACPKVVLKAQSEFRTRLESEPVRFFVREYETLLYSAREELGAFLNANPEDLAFVPNATYGVNSVLRSLALAPGDELLATDHTYNACRNLLEYVAEQAGARVVVASIPIPIQDESSIINAILPLVSSRTKIALLDHVTSPTAVVFPIQTLVRELGNRRVRTLVDGAHAPGMIELNLKELGADYYTGNCHKWMCAPKGAGFLWVRDELQKEVRPAVISHGDRGARKNRSRFRLEFDWTGTHDPSAYLCIPEAIRFLANSHPFGIAGRMKENREACLRAQAYLIKTLGATAVATPQMTGSMASIILPKADWGEGETGEIHPLQNRLFVEHGIEIPVIAWTNNRLLVRISWQLYNNMADYALLGKALSREGCLIP